MGTSGSGHQQLVFHQLQQIEVTRLSTSTSSSDSSSSHLLPFPRWLQSKTRLKDHCPRRPVARQRWAGSAAQCRLRRRDASQGCIAGRRPASVFRRWTRGPHNSPGFAAGHAPLATRRSNRARTYARRERSAAGTWQIRLQHSADGRCIARVSCARSVRESDPVTRYIPSETSDTGLHLRLPARTAGAACASPSPLNTPDLDETPLPGEAARSTWLRRLALGQGTTPWRHASPTCVVIGSATR